MNNSFIKTSFVFFVIILFFFVYTCFGYWNMYMTQDTFSNVQLRNLRISTMTLALFSLFLWLFSGYIKIKGIHLACILWCALMPFVILYNNGTRYDYFDTILWPLLFEVSFLFSRNNQNCINTFRKCFFVIAAYGLLLFFRASIDTDIQTNTIYFSLLTLPWLMSNSKKNLQIVFLILFSLFAVISLKRSSLLVVLLCWGGYVLTLLRRRRTRIFALVIIILIALFGSSFYNQVDSVFGGRLRERVEREETEENGRLGIYIITIEMIRQSSRDHFLLGHGHNGVYKDSPIKISAHNDFLEVIYDYGILIFVLYLCLWVYVFKRCFQLYKMKSSFFFPYFVSLSIFFVMSMVSHLILYTSYFNFLVLFWGAMEGIDVFSNTDAQ